LPGFLDNVWFYAFGSVSAIIIKNQWWLAILNIAIFLSLLLFLGRKNINWKTHGLFSAFIISLFVEMYGASLILYFVSNNILHEATPVHDVLFDITLFRVILGFDLWMTFGGIIILSGVLIIMLGWYQLWSSKKALFTDGLYRYSRHPQYIGFLYTIWGWMIAWPTLTTLIFTPILTYAYLNAAKKEENLMLKENRQYAEYRKKTPFLL
jgi:protein-S-isoprenylcysteine O-methyltransferase Ste14